MSTVSKPGAGAISGPAKGVSSSEGVAKKASVSPDGLDKTKPAKTPSGPEKVSAQPEVPGILESFPIHKLSELDAKGIQGQTFLLDGGSLRGLKLEVRRIRDGAEAGFDLLFKLAPSKLESLLETMKKQDATAGPIEFRELVLGEDGIATYGSAKGQVTGSSSHAPSDTDSASSQWSLRLDGKKGGRIEVAHDKAALAVRGMVRISLRGDDAACTKQLDGLVKSLGLAALFAPPTSKSKRINALMRVLWQVDNGKASELATGDLDKLSIKDLEQALLEAGVTKERIDGLRYEEVYGGHFTVVDPAQTEAMVQAGARYLYSTVTDPAHVHSILLHGQKSSLERYKDGLIINGMSTNSDFASGGGVGVFTRLVTQDAIYDGKSWTGRTYKLLQTQEQFGRTDWYGWNGDYYGRRWGLDSKLNFGVGLVEAIGTKDSYASTNELIFTAGNRPENIQRVIATDEASRKKLIEYLSEKGYEPHNGLSLEEFVVLSPHFLPFGQAPYDVSDPATFLTDAKAKAAEGQLAPLTWFLMEGPESPELRRALEREILVGDDAKLQNILFKAVKLRGSLEVMSELDEVIVELEAKGAAGTTMLHRLANEAAESLFCSGSMKAVDLLVARRAATSNFGLVDDAFVRILNALVDAPGEAQKKAFDLALEVRGLGLVTSRHAGFVDFLAKHPQVQPEDPAAFISTEIAKLKDGPPSLELRLFAAQNLEPSTRTLLETELVRADHQHAVEILKTLVGDTYRLNVDGDTLKSVMDGLQPNSPMRSYLIGQIPDALLKLGHEGLFDLIATHHGLNVGFNIHGADRWLAVADAVAPPSTSEVSNLALRILEHGVDYLPTAPAFLERLPSMTGLYDVADVNLFVQDALKTIQNKGRLQLMFLLCGPKSHEAHRGLVVRELLKAPGQYATKVLDAAKTAPGSNGALPLSVEARRELVKELAPEENKSMLLALLQRDGKQILSEASAELLPIFDTALNETDHLGSFGLSGQMLTEALADAAARTDDDGPAVHTWMLRRGAKLAIQQADAGFIAHLENIKATLETVGIDASQAAADIKTSVDGMKYYYTNASYSGSAPYNALAAGAKWLIMQGDSAPDDKVLEAIENALPGWGWDQALLTAFVERIPELSEAWKTKLAAAAGVQ